MQLRIIMLAEHVQVTPEGATHELRLHYTSVLSRSREQTHILPVG
jgi:hypothetical protein